MLIHLVIPLIRGLVRVDIGRLVAVRGLLGLPVALCVGTILNNVQLGLAPGATPLITLFLHEAWCEAGALSHV